MSGNVVRRKEEMRVGDEPETLKILVVSQYARRFLKWYSEIQYMYGTTSSKMCAESLEQSILYFCCTNYEP